VDYSLLRHPDGVTTVGGMLGEELRRARDEAGLSQEEVAARAEIDRSYLSQLENDKKSPTLDLLFRVCKAIGIKASTLVARVEKGQAKT
jgi:transcriptional regulator with XRE-family HTH domain